MNIAYIFYKFFVNIKYFHVTNKYSHVAININFFFTHREIDKILTCAIIEATFSLSIAV